MKRGMGGVCLPLCAVSLRVRCSFVVCVCSSFPEAPFGRKSNLGISIIIRVRSFLWSVLDLLQLI